MVLKVKRSYLEREWCGRIFEDPEFTVLQDDGRVRHYGFVPELGKYLRVVAPEDGETVHNAMPDRNVTREQGSER